MKIKSFLKEYDEYFSKHKPLLSYDHYDFWSTGFGRFGRRVFYKNKYVGLILLGPFIFFDSFMPYMRKLFVRKKRFPIADAHFAMAYLNMYTIFNDDAYLDKARECFDSLKDTRCPGFDNYCWGYPFNWQSNITQFTKGTPLITSTPYCFEAFRQGFEITGDLEYKDICISIAEHAFNDIPYQKLEDDVYVSSYSTLEKSKVLNANAYRGNILVQATELIGDSKYQLLGEKFLNFVIASQEDSGAYPYEIGHDLNYFIDHFHTCFVLKSLEKANKILKRADIKESIDKGINYYKLELFDENKIPIPFSKAPRLQLHRRELYDFAESINLFALRDDCDSEYIKSSLKYLFTEMKKNNNYFTTRIYLFGIKNNVSYFRWAQAQLFRALTEYVIKKEN